MSEIPSYRALFVYNFLRHRSPKDIRHLAIVTKNIGVRSMAQRYAAIKPGYFGYCNVLKEVDSKTISKR